MVPDRQYSFEIPPDSIPPDDIKETITTEVVVVGAGIAGLSAALSAVEAGAKTYLIEKTSGVQARGHDNAFIGSRLQKKLGIEIDKDEVILNLMKYCGNKPDQRLIRMWAEGSGQTADWLMDMTDAAGIGVIICKYPAPPGFNNATEYCPQYSVTHQFSSQRLVTKCLLNNALKKGAKMYFKTRAKQLIRKGEGRVTGVIAQTADGEYVRFDAAKAVVLCTGDYLNNSEMMAKYCPQSAYLQSEIPTSTGDGHQMAMWIGACRPARADDPWSRWPSSQFRFSPGKHPGRAVSERRCTDQSNVNALERQPGKVAWQVFDSKYPQEISRHGIGSGKLLVATDEVQQEITKIAITADSIEELAAKMKLPVENLKATIKKYNELARLGKDLDFGKRPDRMSPVDTPPYYAGKSGYSLLAVLGGLNVNPELEALDIEWKIIPGLYLAGNTMGNRFASDYTTMCPGLSHGMAIHFGRIAGLHAAGTQ